MTIEQQFIACAELDGWKYSKLSDGKEQETTLAIFQNGGDLVYFDGLPNYNSYDVLIPIIQKQSRGTRWNIFHEITGKESYTLEHLMCLLMATPEQLRVALLKATGKWKECGILKTPRMDSPIIMIDLIYSFALSRSRAKQLETELAEAKSQLMQSSYYEMCKVCDQRDELKAKLATLKAAADELAKASKHELEYVRYVTSSTCECPSCDLYKVLTNYQTAIKDL
jgi:hypothetical protein